MKLKRCRLTEKQQDRLIEFFVGEMTARTADAAVGVNNRTEAVFQATAQGLVESPSPGGLRL